MAVGAAGWPGCWPGEDFQGPCCRGGVDGSGGPGGGAEPVERGLKVPGPGPVDAQAQPPAASGADQPAGDRADAVAECGRFAAGEFPGEAQGLGPGEQVGGAQTKFQPDLVQREVRAGQVTQAGCLPAADPVLYAGVGAVTDFQVGQLAAFGVGEEGGQPVPVGVGEPQLRAGVRPFPAGEQPGAGRPVIKVHAAGDLGDVRAVARLSVDVVGRCPAGLGDRTDRVLDVLIGGEPEREAASPLPQRFRECVGPTVAMSAKPETSSARWISLRRP